MRDGEAAFGGFTVEMGQILAGLLHNRHNIVKADNMRAVREQRIVRTGYSAFRGMSVSFNTGNLNESFNWITGQANLFPGRPRSPVKHLRENSV